MKRSAALATVALLLALGDGAAAQELQRRVVFPDASVAPIAGIARPEPPLRPLMGTVAEAGDEVGLWKSVAIGAAIGGVAGGTAGYLLYPNLIDPWFTRPQWVGITAAQGALGGAAVGALVALVRRKL